ncbi:hypothetical protein J2Y48_002725 [Mycoplana sp. BE70]|uniref:DUF1236 domain-containing protein n=1 Tax=Mycoplana sp. BE70 TaxID=2817775 RepID=UPI002860CBC2|nr:DUF1236 domain-containing protein [Mycoplana sp. BE70]MDR6757429.1 hypothetical protein [Mycoplana sp. BE70]
MRNLFIAMTVGAMSLSASAYAQSTTVVVPGEARTYVLEQQVPSVVYEGDVVVGEPIPDIVELHTIQGHGDYAYVVVNNRRVIVNPQTRAVIQVLE